VKQHLKGNNQVRMTTIALRSEFKKEKVTSNFFVRSHFVNNLKLRKQLFKFIPAQNGQNEQLPFWTIRSVSVL
jgi:hypothetical protein